MDSFLITWLQLLPGENHIPMIKSKLHFTLEAVSFTGKRKLTCSMNIHNMWLPAPLWTPPPPSLGRYQEFTFTP